jgi:hypothetical protein
MESNSSFTRWPVLQVAPHKLIVYERIEWHVRPHKRDRGAWSDKCQSNTYQAGSNKNRYTGSLSKSARKKMRKAIALMVASSAEKEVINFTNGKRFRFRINFITLTLPSAQGDITDKQIKQACLEPFFQRMRRKHGMRSYVWRAERQKNGNLHFHVLSETWIHYIKLREEWNECVQKLGMIDAFYAKHGHRDPNSTDVHAVWNVEDVEAYVTKYMSKDASGKDKVEGKLWDCSENLKTGKTFEIELSDSAVDAWLSAKADKDCRYIHEDRFELILMKEKTFERHVIGKLHDDWHNYLKDVRTNWGKWK